MWRNLAGCVLLAWALLAGAAGLDTEPLERANAFLSPQGMIVGGFSAPASPVPGRPPTGAYLKLLHPSALAANGPDLYVADSGQRLLLHFDTVSQSVTPLREIPPLPGVRIKAGADGSVYVVRPDRGEVARLARDGRPIATFSAKFEILQPADIVIEPTLNRPWISDAAGGVFAFHPSGRKSEPLVGRGDGFSDEFGGATLLAASRERVTGFDPRCRCLIDFDREGAVIGKYGEGELLNPADLALDAAGRTWVVDRGDRRLKIFDQGRLVAALQPPQLGLVDVTAISIDLHTAYIADGPAGRIGIFGITPPSRR
ncbi:hypothetical protein [Azoarcus sp. DN11]|uniref:hypothetical protein n=1 Tax=Azoarcus sp. DN11 TaxID=356837 RepID=UPI000EB265A9|nr:hypothetical protein [Azoarcus sp. DN11]AYH42056.1 hypothetical protein CDA09_01430 [Azoarcus sp. DN11]